MTTPAYPTPTASPNPYDPTQPTADPALFYGQEAAFAFIRQQAFAERRPRAPLLIGRRGIGKTSILWQVPHRLDARTVAVYVDLDTIDLNDPDGSGELAGLWIALSVAARRALDAAGVSIYRLPELPADGSADQSAAAIREWFTGEYLTIALSAMRQRRLLFLFDNTGALLDRIGGQRGLPTVLDHLGELLMYDERIKCLFALDLADAERAERHALLSDPLLVYRVPYLADFEADALIREPVVFAYGLHSEAARAIRGLCGGFPYALHAVNRAIFDRSAARGHASAITVDDVLAVLPDAIRAIDPICAPEWALSAVTERRVLASLGALAESNAGRPITREVLYAHLVRVSEGMLDETSLIVSLRRLEYQDVIRAYPDRGYVFAVALQQQWLLLYGQLPPPASMKPTTPIAAVSTEPIADAAVNNSQRRARLPIGGLIGLIVLIGALVAIFAVNRSTSGGSNGFGGSPEAPTVTLDVNLQGTGLALNAAQTATAGTGTAHAAANFAGTQTAGALTSIALTPTATATPSNTITSTASSTLSITRTATYTASVTRTFTPSITVSPSPTADSSATSTLSPTASHTFTATATPSITASRTPSPTTRPTLSPSATATNTASNTATFTPSATGSPTTTPTITLTATPQPPVTIQAFPTHLLPTSGS